MTRPRILMAGPIPPPPGGIASVVAMIVEGELTTTCDFVPFPMSALPRPALGRIGRAVNAALARSFGFEGLVSVPTWGALGAFRAALTRGPDLVHLHCSSGYDFWLTALMAREARRRGIPTLHHLHGAFDVSLPSWSRARQLAFHRALRVPDRVVVLSEGWRRWFEGHMEPARIEVLRNAVDVRRFAPRDRAASRGDTVTLLFVGVSEPVRKGGYEILDVAARVVREQPQIRFVFVGKDVEGLEQRFVRRTELEPFVRFVGSKNAAEMVGCFEAADLLLLPSHAEGLPIALLEAMAAGLPVIACGVNGIPEAMCEPENGILLRPGDRDALAAAILELVRDPARRQQIGVANRERMEREFDCSHYARALGAIYARALGGPARA